MAKRGRPRKDLEVCTGGTNPTAGPAKGKGTKGGRPKSSAKKTPVVDERVDTPAPSAKIRRWDKELPAIKDEHGVTIVGHRRLKIADEDGIEPVIKVVTFGDGPEAEAARIRLANVSNLGAAPMTANDRKRQAARLYESGLTMEAIGHMLGVSHMTISRDLEGFNTVLKPTAGPAKGKGTKGAGREY